MKRIGILGDIGAGKTYIAKSFGYPVFDADKEVGKLYRNNKKIFKKLQKALPKYIFSFPIDKNEISKAILIKNSNLKKIINVVHFEIRKKMNLFLKKNRYRKYVILDIPLLLENNLNKKKDILIFIQSKRSKILSNLKKRKNFNKRLMNRFRNIQLPLDYKKKKSHFIIKNNFTNKSIKKEIRYILKKIL